MKYVCENPYCEHCDKITEDCIPKLEGRCQIKIYRFFMNVIERENIKPNYFEINDNDKLLLYLFYKEGFDNALRALGSSIITNRVVDSL